MQLRGLLPCSQEPATGPNPKQTKPSPHLLTLFISNPFLYYPSIMAYVFQVVSSLWLKFCMHFSPVP